MSMAGTNGYPNAAPFPPMFNNPSIPSSMPLVRPYGAAQPVQPRPVWTEHVTAEGRKYFFNTQTRKTTWEKPDDLKTEAEKILSRCPWREYRAQNGKVYYSHLHSKQSVWTKPPELEEAEMQAQLASQNASQNSVSSPLAFPYRSDAPGTPGNSNSLPGSPGRPSMPSSAIEEAMKKTLESFDSGNTPTHRSPSRSDDSDSSADNKKSKKNIKTELRTQQDKEDCFRDLLRLRKVPSTAQWETAVKMIQDDPRYQLIKHLKNRKQIFNIYKTQRQKEEKEEQRLRYKKAKEDLEQFLLNSSRIGSNLRYRKADMMFAELKVWSSVPESDRRDIYHDAVKEIEKREREDAKALQKRNIESFTQILDSMKQLNSLSTWTDLQQMLVENDRFKENDELLNMDKEDALICFQNHVSKLEKEEDDKKEEDRLRQKRQHRKNREAFLVFLDELRDLNKLTSMSQWHQCYPDICDDIRFEQMLIQPGSTPLDLFKFYIEDLRKKFPEEKRIVKEIMKDRAFIIDSHTTYEEFFTMISSDERGRLLDSGNVRRSFDSLMQKALSIDEEKKQEEKKTLRKYGEEFKLLLQTSEPPITAVNTSWDDIVERFGHEECFQGLQFESERLQVFKEFLKEHKDHAAGSKSGKKKKKKDRKKKKSKDKKKSDGEDSGEEEESSPDKEKDRKKKRKKERRERENGESESDESSVNKKSKKKRKHKKKKRKKIKDKEDKKQSDSEVSEGEISEGDESPPTKKLRKTKELSRASGESELSEGELEQRRQTLLAQLDR